MASKLAVSVWQWFSNLLDSKPDGLLLGKVMAITSGRLRQRLSYLRVVFPSTSNISTGLAIGQIVGNYCHTHLAAFTLSNPAAEVAAG